MVSQNFRQWLRKTPNFRGEQVTTELLGVAKKTFRTFKRWKL